MKQTFSKYDRFIMAFLKVLIITVHDLQKQLFSLREYVCLKRLRKFFQKVHIPLQVLLKVYTKDPN